MALSRIHPELDKTEAKQSLAFFNWNLVFRNLFDSICAIGGFVFVDYALSLGIAKERMGIFAALVNLACLFQIAGLLAINFINDRKRFVLIFGYLEPALLIVAVLAALFAPAHLRFPLLVACVFVSSASVHLTRPTTDDWLATAIPERIRGRFLGRRFQISSIVMIAITLVMGFVAQYFNRDYSLGFALFLAVGGILGLLAAHMYRSIVMPRTAAESRLCWKDVSQIIRHRPFTRYLAGNLIYNLPFWLAAPYYQVFHLKVLDLREVAIACLMIGSFAIKIAIFPLLGRWVDRVGARKMIYLVTPLYATFFFLYVVSDARLPWLIFIAWALAGFADAAFGVASTSALYKSVENVSVRQAFFATYNLCCFSLAALGAAAGAFLVNIFKNTILYFGPFTLGPFHLLYLICFLLFLPCFLSAKFFPGLERKVNRL